MTIEETLLDFLGLDTMKKDFFFVVLVPLELPHRLAEKTLYRPYFSASMSK